MFGRRCKTRASWQSIGTATIRVPLPAHQYYAQRSFLIQNEIPMLLEIETQKKLRTFTDRDPDYPTATFKAIASTVLLAKKFVNPYYKGPKTNDHLFSMSELAQVNRNLEHGSTGSI